MISTCVSSDHFFRASCPKEVVWEAATIGINAAIVALESSFYGGLALTGVSLFVCATLASLLPKSARAFVG